jgi:hypothetical protein
MIPLLPTPGVFHRFLTGQHNFSSRRRIAGSAQSPLLGYSR